MILLLGNTGTNGTLNPLLIVGFLITHNAYTVQKQIVFRYLPCVQGLTGTKPANTLAQNHKEGLFMEFCFLNVMY
jgi:hypothetical protein